MKKLRLFTFLMFLAGAPLWAAAPPAVSTGPVLVGSVVVQGNQDVSSWVIQRGLDLEPGHPFKAESVKDGQDALYASGCFDTIDIAITSSTAHRVDAVITVQEREAQYLRGSFGYGTQTKERLSLGYEDHNFFGNLRQFNVKATYSGFITHPYKYKTRILETNLTQPYIFDTRLDGSLNLSQEWDNREAYDSVASKFMANLSRRFSRAFDTRLRYRLSSTHLTRVSPEAETPDTTRIVALGPTATYDATDDRFLPTRGWRVIGTWEEGLRALGSDVGFHKLEGRTGRFDTLQQWTFFEGIQAGTIFPHAGQSADVIPIFERYFLGGANTVRGYSERDLGPKDVDGNPLGGEAFFVANFEIRRKIYKQLWGVVFLDGGQLYETDPGDVMPQIHLNRWDDLAYGSGAGLRMHTPIGALRLEFGYKLNPPPDIHGFWDRTAIHFSIGEVF